ncbi:MAG: hypothetical protein AAGE52_11920 [Myxococcota bacterium]
MKALVLILAMLSTSVAFADAEEDSTPVATPFVGLDWRVMGLSDHVSHGPGFQVGALLFGHFKVGIAGFMRPGPINPRTFELDLEGGSYRGQERLDLRSDGSVVGLLLAPRFGLGEWLDLEIPVLLGFGAFGFYLTDDDRDTPDGRRVSEWEDELLDGADASEGFAIDVGLRVSFKTRQSWLRPYLGVHYSWIVGYDATLRGNYDGISGVFGIEVGGF